MFDMKKFDSEKQAVVHESQGEIPEEVIRRIVEASRKMGLRTNYEDFTWRVLEMRFGPSKRLFTIEYMKKLRSAYDVADLLDALMNAFSPDFSEYVDNGTGRLMTVWTVKININNLSENEIEKLKHILGENADWKDENWYEYDYVYYDGVIEINGTKYRHAHRIHLDTLDKNVMYDELLIPIDQWAASID